MNNQQQIQIKAVQINRNLKNTICGLILGIIALTNTNSICDKIELQCMTHSKKHAHLTEERFNNSERLIYVSGLSNTLSISIGTPLALTTEFRIAETIFLNGNIVINFGYQDKNIN